MDSDKAKADFGRLVFGLGVVALALVCLAWGDFDPGQPVPSDIPGRTILAYVAAGIMLAGGAAVLWRRTADRGAAVLTLYYALIVVLLMNGRMMLGNPDEYLVYSNTAGQLAIAAGGLIIYATHARIDPVLARRLINLGQILFGICAVLWGGAHFFYMNFTAPLVPRWLPPSPEFWAYATGVFHILGGLAILTGTRARLAAILLTVMYAAFQVLVHAPMVLANPTRHWNWAEFTVNLATVGVAWVVADSLARRTAESG